MESNIKKRWISLFVENEIGVLAKVSGLFASKSYNIDTLTVGETEDPTVSRMTISLTMDAMTFEQVKKQLNRSVSIIKVVDYTELPIILREILLIKIRSCTESDKAEIFRIAQVYDIPIANNKATADFLITSPFMNSEYEHTVINFQQNIKDRAGRL